MQEGRSIYRKEALERLSRPEQLNDYIRVTTPGVWVVMAALTSALLGLLAWGVFGAVVVSVEARGVAYQGEYICYAENVDKISVGMQAVVEGRKGYIKAIAKVPEDRGSLASRYADYILYDLAPPEYSYAVTLNMPAGGEDGVFDAHIITERVRPISFITG